jgi:nicotinamidase-related amidase
MAGVSTSGVILSTVRWLADADFSITVIRDCCADRDNDVHTMLCNKVRYPCHSKSAYKRLRS